MRFLFLSLCLCLPLSVLAESLPIRGMTGGGYGAFSWGTSLSTVYKQTSGLKLFKDAPESIAEYKRIAALKRARSKVKKAVRKSFPGFPALPRIERYEKWISINGLQGRVEYGFFDGQLYQVIVRLIYPKKDQKKEQKIISRLLAKYGNPIRDHAGKIGKLIDNRIVFGSEGGPVMVDRLRPAKKDGLLRLTYQSPKISTDVDRYLDRLAFLVGRYSPKKNPPLPRKATKRTQHPIDKNI
ncbi:MAG: hypothetical protein VYA30_10300 [Myxococcota bacterium]|nr:hypothetical protein [Myxococcota bacterium]